LRRIARMAMSILDWKAIIEGWEGLKDVGSSDVESPATKSSIRDAGGERRGREAAGKSVRGRVAVSPIHLTFGVQGVLLRHW
jgi:hypothetical protein